jgi:hypothetical protein
MASTKTFVRSFSGGEISTEMFGRIDDAKFQTGAERLRNFVVKPQGPAVRRPGTQFVRETKDGTKKSRLIPFVYSTDQTMVIELGDSHIRFHTDGGTLVHNTPVPTAFIPSNATITFDDATDEVVWNSHPLVADNEVSFTVSGGIPPAGINVGQTYYAVIQSSNRIKLAETAGAGGITFTGAGSGIPTGYRRYQPGTLISYLTHNYICLAENDSDVPPAFPTAGDGWWYLQPATGELELPAPWLEAELFNLTYAQSNDILTIAGTTGGTRELKRLSATEWVLETPQLVPALSHPESIVLTASRGEAISISTISVAATALIDTDIAHRLSVGDPVYIGGINPSLGGLVDGFYIVNTTPLFTRLTVRDYSGGGVIGTTGTYTAATDYVQFGSRTVDVTKYYKVTAVSADGNESEPSVEQSVTNNLFITGAYNTIEWAEVEGAARYKVYKKQSGLYGYIGQTETESFIDDNIAPDMGVTPPIRTNGELILPDNYPGAVAYFEQRRCFAGTPTEPQSLFLTRSGSDYDLAYSLPTIDTDRIKVQIAARESNTIRHIVPMSELLLLTNSAEWRVTAVNSEALTPTSISIRAQSYIGANHAQPQIVNNSLVFCANRGGHVRELAFNWQAQGYQTGDLSLRAAHLFDNYEIRDMTYAKCPIPVLWFTSTSGQLLSLTYVPEEQVGAWCWHDTDGEFESVCSVPEGEEDSVYVSVKRTIDGSTVRYIEKFAPYEFAALEDAFYVDSGLTFDGTNTVGTALMTLSAATWTAGSTITITATAHSPFIFPTQSDVGDQVVFYGSDGTEYRITIAATSSATVATGTCTATIPAELRAAATATWAWARDTMSGLGHIEGESLSILADGTVHSAQTVDTAAISLNAPYVKVHAGLGYTSDLKTLPMAIQMEGFAQGRTLNVNAAWVRFYQTAGGEIGPDEDRLIPLNPTETGDEMRSVMVDTLLLKRWQQGGQVWIRQDDPLPMTVVSITAEVSIGG